MASLYTLTILSLILFLIIETIECDFPSKVNLIYPSMSDLVLMYPMILFLSYL